MSLQTYLILFISSLDRVEWQTVDKTVTVSTIFFATHLLVFSSSTSLLLLLFCPSRLLLILLLLIGSQLLWASVGLTKPITKLQLLTSILFQSDHVYLLRRCRRLQVHLITLKTHSRSVGFFRTRDGTVAETSIWPHTHTHNTDKEQTAMSPLGFEAAIPGS